MVEPVSREKKNLPKKVRKGQAPKLAGTKNLVTSRSGRPFQALFTTVAAAPKSELTALTSLDEALARFTS